MKKKKNEETQNVEQQEKQEETLNPEETAAEENKEPVTLTQEEFQKVQEHIESLQKEKDEMQNLAQRTQADFDNFRRRNASIRSESLEEGKRECIKALLPVLDNFDRAMETDAEPDKAWKEGIALVQKQLLDELSKMGMSEIEADGKFDPNLHNAVMQEKAEDKESGDILAVFQKGYRVGDRIIRHSMVKVAE